MADIQKLTQSEDFDYLHYIENGYTQIRRYAPAFLDILQLKAAPAAKEIIEAAEVIKTMNVRQARKVPESASKEFIRKRWERLVFSADGGINRYFYELCVLSELKNALRSGDIWVQGSRQFKDFEEYLLPVDKFNSLKESGGLPIKVPINCQQYLHDRLNLLQEQLEIVDRLAKANELPDAIVTTSGLKITPLTNAVPKEAEAFVQQAYNLLPCVKITELLMEVDEWNGFTKHFTHIKNGMTVSDKHLLLTAILADAINLGLSKMSESCPGTTYAKLSWLQAWHIRDETYSSALGELINA